MDGRTLGRGRPNHQDRAAGAVRRALADAAEGLDSAEATASENEQIGLHARERIDGVGLVVGEQ
jgi:hypothetical protein